MFLVFCFELRYEKRFHFPVRTIAAGVLLCILITPLLLQNLYYTGYPVPDYRFAKMMSKQEIRFGINLKYSNPIIEHKLEIAVPIESPVQTVPIESPAQTDTEQADNTTTPLPEIQPVITDDPLPELDKTIFDKKEFEMPERHEIIRSCTAFFDGFYRYYAPFIFLMVIMRIVKKTWKKEETILFSILFGYMVLMMAQILIFDKRLYITDRYLLPAAPLGFGWAGSLLTEVWKKIKESRWSGYSKYALIFFITGVLIFALIDGHDQLRKDICSTRAASKRAITFDIAEWVKKDYAGKHYIAPIRLDEMIYLSNQRPLIAGNSYCAVTPRVGGFMLNIPEYEFFSVLFSRPADYLIYDNEEFVVAPPGYELAYEIKTKENYVFILRYHPEHKTEENTETAE